MTDRFTRGVHHEVSNSHLTRGNECCEPREKPKRNHQPADEFDDSTDQHYSLGATMPAAGKAQHLLTTVTCEHKTDYQSHNTVNWIRKSIKSVHSDAG